MIEVPEQALALMRRFEGCRLNAYKCPAGVWTIGYGHTKGVKQGDVIDQQTAERFLREDAQDALEQTLALCPGLSNGPINRLAAIVDFTFNLGPTNLAKSTLLKRLNAEQWDLVPAELRKWVNAKGKKLPGLVARREAEVKLWEAYDSNGLAAG